MLTDDAWRGRRVLVTGGTGFIGRHVLARGVAAGAEMYSLATRRGDVDGVRYCSGNLADRVATAEHVRAIEPNAVVHLAAAGVRHGDDALADLLRANVLGTEHVLAAVRALSPAPSVVVAGSGYEYAAQDRATREDDPIEPATAYGVAKAGASLCAAWYARTMPVTLLRLFNVYGPGEGATRIVPSVVTSAAAGVPVELSAGEQLRDFVHVTDVADAFWRALCRPAAAGSMRVLNVGSGEGVKLKMFVEMLASILRDRGLKPCLRFGAKPYRPGEPMTYVADPTRARRELEWAPSLSLATGLAATVDSLL